MHELEIKERDYISKIAELELAVSRLSCHEANRRVSIEQGASLPPANRSAGEVGGREEQKFCEVVRKTYGDLFGATGYKEIWKKHKEILQEWTALASRK